MNGRVYDPTIARFLSADPHIQAPSNLQSYNRYSYVLNNPLKYTDPSGYFFKKLKKFVKKSIRPVLAIAAAVFIPGVGGGLVSGLIGSGGDLKAGLAGALTAGLMGGVHGIGGFKGAFAHGVIGGTHSRLTGGSFRDGFLGSVASFGLGAKFGGKIADGASGLGFGERFSKVLSGAVIGGSASAIAGGQFKHGAWAGGFSTAFNDLSKVAAGGGTAIDGFLGGIGKGIAGFGGKFASFLRMSPVGVGITAMSPTTMGDATLTDADFQDRQPRTMYHYSPDATLKGGELWPNSYLTTNGNMTSDQAINQLALTLEPGTPMYVHTFSVYPGEYIPAPNSIPGTRFVAPANGKTGWGIEYISTRTLAPVGPSRPAF